MEVFNIKIEFDHGEFRQKITTAIEKKMKGYVCVVDGNVLTMTSKDPAYCDIVKNAYVNTCDGSSIAVMVNWIYGTNCRPFTGPELFEEFIEKTQYNQLLLGNTEEKYLRIKGKLTELGKENNHLKYMAVPFASVDHFDYAQIGADIKKINPDIIWVSLGAPKQERFMARLLPYLNTGLLFGIGAAFNFYVGDNPQPKYHLGFFNLIWLDRIFREPKKQINRVFNAIKAYPKIFIDEKRRKRSVRVE